VITYISIGNSDNRLTQAEWSAFVLQTRLAVDRFAEEVHGEWYSNPAAQWQNACWCVDLPDDADWVAGLKDRLRLLTIDFRQDSIAWAEAPTTEFLKARRA